MSTVRKFKSFPNAYPHIREDRIPAAENSLMKLEGSDQEKLASKIRDSILYYDLMALVSRGYAADQKSLGRLRRGLVTKNTDTFRRKDPSEGKGMFRDPESRWYRMSRADARNIVMDEIFPQMVEGSAATPTPTPSSSTTDAAESTTIKVVRPLAGIAIAVGLGYAVSTLFS